MSLFIRHPRGSGDPEALERFARLFVRWVPAFAGMTMLVMALLTAPAIANDTLPPAPYAYRQLDDPKLEAKAQALMETLRCLTCQSQSIADSDASMAGDLRNEIRTRIAAGESPAHIRQWLIGRYGDYISYRPRAEGTRSKVSGSVTGTLRTARDFARMLP